MVLQPSGTCLSSGLYVRSLRLPGWLQQLAPWLVSRQDGVVLSFQTSWLWRKHNNLSSSWKTCNNVTLASLQLRSGLQRVAFQVDASQEAVVLQQLWACLRRNHHGTLRLHRRFCQLAGGLVASETKMVLSQLQPRLYEHSETVRDVSPTNTRPGKAHAPLGRSHRRFLHRPCSVCRGRWNQPNYLVEASAAGGLWVPLGEFGDGFTVSHMIFDSYTMHELKMQQHRLSRGSIATSLPFDRGVGLVGRNFIC